MTVRVLAAVLLLVATAPGWAALDVDLKAYDDARRRGQLTTITGRVYAERRKPNSDDLPFVHAAVVVLPRSDALLRRFEELRAQSRESVAAYKDAATQMRQARERYERQIWEAGNPDLVRSTTVDDQGRFRMDDLPAGRWMIWVTHSDFMSTRSPKPIGRERERFRLPPRLVGYYSERAWLREVDATAGREETVELNDRNVWFSGVVEERVLDAGSR